MGKGSGLHSSMLVKQCLTRGLGFNVVPKSHHYPEMEGFTLPLPAGGLAPGPSNPAGGPAGTVYPSGTCLQRMGTTHSCTLVTLSHRMKNLAKRSLGNWFSCTTGVAVPSSHKIKQATQGA